MIGRKTSLQEHPVFWLLAFLRMKKEEDEKTVALAPPPGGYLKMFNTGRLRTEIQTLTISYTILAKKGTPFTYLL